MKKAISSYLRGIKRSKISFIINLIGLSTGLACTFLIYLWVRDEMSIDKFHKNDELLYQVMINEEENGSVETSEIGPGVLADELVEGIPEIEKSVAVIDLQRVNTLSNKDKSFKAKGIYASKDFFELFSFNLLEGGSESVLSDQSNIVITKQLALNLFGTTENVIGSSIEFDKKEQFKIAGIADKIPAKSSIQFDFVLLLSVFNRHTGFDISWDESNATTYILINDKTEVADLNSKLQSWGESQGENLEDETLFVRQFSDGYLYGNYENGIQKGGRIDYLKIFSITGIIILLIACINFISLSTAVATNRMKEVGMKKILGAKRSSIIFQHLLESTFLAFLSLIVAFILVFLLLPSFNHIADKHIQLSLSIEILLAFFTIALLTGILAGLYPAFYISAFKPVMVLKGEIANTLGGGTIRKGLVITQFVISVILLMITLVVYNQFLMIQNKNLGYNKDAIIYFDMDGRMFNHREAFLSELRKQPGVRHASSIFSITKGGVFGAMGSTSHLSWPGKTPGEEITMATRRVDYGLIEVLALEMKEGRSFSEEFNDASPEIIFNEAAVKAMRLENPVGTTVEVWGLKPTIVGVVKDFYFESIQAGKVQPMFLIRDPDLFNTIIVKVNTSGLDRTIKSIEKFHSQFNPGFPFVYNFLDEDFQKLYSTEMKMSVLSRYFAGLAILISCLGLFGLTAFTVNKRKREISIRKVLGATGMQIVLLLYRDISKLVLVSLLIGLPIGHLIASNWLDGFAERIDMEPWFFIAAGGLSYGLMLVASGIQVLKALVISPVESLRTE
jgi:putative ABC transport system permease protein